MSVPDSLFARLDAQRSAGRGLPPVERWAPARTGPSRMRIDVDGRWFHEGSEIRRAGMVRLFSTILRRDPDGHVLVTPAERLYIDVDDAPFVAVDFEARGAGAAQDIAFLTNVGDLVMVDAEHPIRVEGGPRGPRPYVLVRRGLEARIARSVFYRLVELTEQQGGKAGVRSRGEFFALE
jgi:hypothetical protein